MRRIDLVSIRGRFFAVSAAAVVASLLLLAIFGLRPGIEFTAGTTTLIRFAEPVSQAELRTTYASLGHADALIQSTGLGEYLIRTGELEVPEGGFTEVAPSAQSDTEGTGPAPLREIAIVTLGASPESTDDVDLYLPADGDACTPGEVAETLPVGTDVSVVQQVAVCDPVVYRVLVDGTLAYVAGDQVRDYRDPDTEANESPVTEDAGERTVIEQALFDEYGHFDVLEFASVSAVVSSVAVRNSALAVGFASLFIMAYVWFAFASLPGSRRYAACTVVALLHDVIIVLGAFALFGEPDVRDRPADRGWLLRARHHRHVRPHSRERPIDAECLPGGERQRGAPADHDALAEHVADPAADGDGDAVPWWRDDPGVPPGHPRRARRRDVLQHRCRGAVARGVGRRRLPSVQA